ncbi:MAG: COG1470 family protein [Candidatus Asgardarchaeia archaeon]
MGFKEALAFILTLVALLLTLYGCVLISVRYIRVARADYCSHFSINLEPEVREVELEPGRGKLVKVKLTNIGFEDEFSTGAKGPRWVVVKPEKIRLDSGESEDIFVYMSPGFGVQGEFNVRVFAHSYCGYKEVSIRVGV